MSYEYDIFVSYRRSQTVGKWVKNHLVPRLEARIDDVAPNPARVSCDFEMAEGVNWPAELKHRLRTSSLLLAVWTASYFRSNWCMAEWQSFRRREMLLGLFSDEQTQGLIYPICYDDGNHFHAEAKQTQSTKNFAKLNYPDEIFSQTVFYLEFDDLVKKIAAELVVRLGTIPAWRDDFPIVEPKPLAQVTLDRPLI